MKTVFKSDEIAHVWANRGAPYGRSPGNVSFEGDAIKSYATVIARRITHKGREAFVYDGAQFSITTSGAQHEIRGAIPSEATVFHIRSGRREQDLRFTPVTLRDFFIKQAAESETEMPSRYAFKRAEQYQHVTAQLVQAVDVCKFFGLGHAALDKRIAARLAGESEAAATLGAYRSKLIDAKAAKDARELAERTARNIKGAQEFIAKGGADEFFDLDRKASSVAMLPEPLRTEFVRVVEASNATLVSRWQAGMEIRLPHDCATLLRVEADEMVTSRGARVPLKAARKTYRFALLVKAKGWHRNGETHKIGMYDLDAVNEVGVVAGCHRVTWSEIERFAKAQGWAK